MMAKQGASGAASTRWHEVLIVTGGSTPQVVTETVYALARRRNDPIVPDRIICIITEGVAARFRTELPAQLAALASDWKIPGCWGALDLEIPRNTSGVRLGDVRTHDDAVHFGDLVAKIVRRETASAKSRVHLSLAGGRKPMSYHGGAAMTLFGRLQDELSHVLVEPDSFEGCADFWFPTSGSRMVKHRDGTSHDAKDANIELSLNPFLRMGENLPAWLRDEDLDYSSYVAQAQAVADRRPLELVTSRRLVRISGLAGFELPNREFALFQLMAEWCLRQHAGAGLNGVGREHRGWLTPRMLYEPDTFPSNAVERFLGIYDATFLQSGAAADRPKVHPLTKSRPYECVQDNKAYFDPVKSRLVDALQRKLHVPELSFRYGAPAKSLRTRFGLALAPNEIDIRVE